MINKKCLYTLMTTLILATPMAAIAQDTSNRSMEQYTCKDVMRQSDDDRAISIAFLHGYFLGKSGHTKFNLDDLAKQTDEFIDQCLDNPKDKAMDIMMKVKK